MKRRRDMWREKMTENEGSLVNRVMNGKVAGETQRETQKNDGEMNLEDCATSLLLVCTVCGLCMYNNL